MKTDLTTGKLDAFFRSFLDFDGFASDSALNGIQVDNDGSAVSIIAFGVDAAMETFEQAAAINAGMLFVHHGLFWGSVPSRVTGNLRNRIKFLLDHNICLYAAHLPLDQHPMFGNNAVLAQLLGLKNVEPFGEYHGKKIGCKGTFPKPITIDEAVKKISFMNRPPSGIFPFGKKDCLTAAVVSGGASLNAHDAIKEGIDLFITGESSHSVYHDCLEAKLNLIAGGHYSTEVWGPQAVMRHCIAELGIEAEFIDIPTGL